MTTRTTFALQTSTLNVYKFGSVIFNYARFFEKHIFSVLWNRLDLNKSYENSSHVGEVIQGTPKYRLFYCSK